MYEFSAKLQNDEFNTGSSNANKKDGEKWTVEVTKEGYITCTPSGTLHPFWIAKEVTPKQRLPPAESPVMMIFPNLSFKYFSAY